MQIGKDRFAVRILPRHLHAFLERGGQEGELDVALCIGCDASVLLAAATSLELGEDELHVANALQPLALTRAQTVDVLVPATAEFVLEGRITRETHREGPFVDVTGTYDIEREQPVFVVNRITHRAQPLYHALLPGGLEHRLLMGVPKEAAIFRKVDKVCRCLDVSVTPGGCSWLHAVIRIDKQNEADGQSALEAAFRGHSSLKHAYVVDSDIDADDPAAVEWAMATRFQGDRDLVVETRRPGSSLDPSADQATRDTSRLGFDLTMPLGGERSRFEKAQYADVDIDPA